MEEGLLEFHACALLMKEHKKAIAKMCIISAGQIICWFGVPYMVYLALGYQGSSFLHIFVLQILIYMSFVPSYCQASGNHAASKRICLPSTCSEAFTVAGFHDGGGSFKPGDRFLLPACIERHRAASHLPCAAAQMRNTHFPSDFSILSLKAMGGNGKVRF
ncbi:MAG: hypothetical protein ACLTT1_10715 [[Clostridium] scindens]